MSWLARWRERRRTSRTVVLDTSRRTVARWDPPGRVQEPEPRASDVPVAAVGEPDVVDLPPVGPARGTAVDLDESWAGLLALAQEAEPDGGEPDGEEPDGEEPDGEEPVAPPTAELPVVLDSRLPPLEAVVAVPVPRPAPTARDRPVCRMVLGFADGEVEVPVEEAEIEDVLAMAGGLLARHARPGT